MMLTYKLKHGRNFSAELKKARQVAEHAVKYRSNSSASVKHIGLKSMIANQILRKYGHNRNIKRVTRVKLIVPSQGVRVDHNKRTITVPCLKLSLAYQFPEFVKVNQVEVGEEYAYATVTVREKAMKTPERYLGVDLNATGHAAVVADPMTGKVWKLGKQLNHVHKKYTGIRRRLQRQRKYCAVKTIKDRESRIIRDLNHKISQKIVEVASGADAGIKLEELNGVRNNRKHTRPFNGTLNSWPFYQLQTFVEYKAKLRGVKIVHVEPAYTSQKCSRCGHMGERRRKVFKCHVCGHVEDADANASFNIALRQPSVPRFSADRDALEGSTDTPQRATPTMSGGFRTPRL